MVQPTTTNHTFKPLDTTNSLLTRPKPINVSSLLVRNLVAIENSQLERQINEKESLGRLQTYVLCEPECSISEDSDCS